MAVAKNDITGDAIQTRGSTKEYQENLDRIFKDSAEERARKAKEKEEYFAKLNQETKEKLDKEEVRITAQIPDQRIKVKVDEIK